jgi:hypothetical protein
MNQQTDLIQTDSKLTEKGKEIYQSNQYWQNLANVMEHPEFRRFFNNYIQQDFTTAKTTLMLMKLYSAVEKHSNLELTPYQKIAITSEILDDEEMRQKVCQGMVEWLKQT